MPIKQKKDNKYKLFARLKKLSNEFETIDELWGQWDLKDTMVVSNEKLSAHDIKIIEGWNTHKFHDEDKGKYTVCLCSHNPISVLNFMKNRETKERCIVGSCCIKKFATSHLKTQMRIMRGEKKGFRYCKYCKRRLPTDYEHWKTYHKKCYFQAKSEEENSSDSDVN